MWLTLPQLELGWEKAAGNTDWLVRTQAEEAESEPRAGGPRGRCKPGEEKPQYCQLRCTSLAAAHEGCSPRPTPTRCHPPSSKGPLLYLYPLWPPINPSSGKRLHSAGRSGKRSDTEKKPEAWVSPSAYGAEGGPASKSPFPPWKLSSEEARHHSDLLLQGWGLLFFHNPLSHPALSSPSPCTGLLTLRQLAAFRAAGELGKESAQGGEEHRLVYSPVCALGRLLDLPRLPLRLQHRPKGVTAQTPIKCPKSALCTVRVLTGTAVLICSPPTH